MHSSPTSLPGPIPTALGRCVPNGLVADSVLRLDEEAWSSRSGLPVGNEPVTALEPERKSGQPALGTQEGASPSGLSGEAFAAALREQPKLRQALVARYGVDVGEQAVAAAMAWAWEHQDRLVGVTALRAYLFRVGQSSTRRSWVWASRNSASFPPEVADEERSSIDDALDLADLLRKLPQKQRTCVLLIYAHGWPYRDVAELLELVKPRDKVAIRTNTFVYEYTVKTVFIVSNTVKANRVSTPVIDIPASLNGHAILTLTTQHPKYTMKQSLVVRAELSGINYDSPVHLNIGTLK